MKTISRNIILLSLLVGFLFQTSLYSQIDDIKKKSNDNKGNKSDNRGSLSDGDSNGSIGESCASAIFESCLEFGCSILGSVFVEYTSYVYKFKSTNPAILSLDIDASLAPAYHYSGNGGYRYMVYLPGLRANLASFMIDFRLNLLTEFQNNLPNSFKCWDVIAGFNIVPTDAIVITLGMGAQREMHNNLYFSEYYIGSKIGLVQNRDYLDLSFRCSADYETHVFPFQEAAIKYNFRLIDFNHIYVHLKLGGLYQNYYQSHDIWALQTGLVLNIH